jgi:hypothetical protein
MQTTFENPSDVNGLKALVRVTTYEFAPYVKNGRSIEKVIDQTEIEIPLDRSLLTHDTIMWSGYFLSLTKLVNKVAESYSGNLSIQLLNVI